MIKFITTSLFILTIYLAQDVRNELCICETDLTTKYSILNRFKLKNGVVYHIVSDDSSSKLKVIIKDNSILLIDSVYKANNSINIMQRNYVLRDDTCLKQGIFVHEIFKPNLGIIYNYSRWFDNDTIKGVSIEENETGTLTISSYKNGKKNGVEYKTYKSKNILEITNYKNDTLNGDYKILKNGEVYYFGQMKDGAKIGEWIMNYKLVEEEFIGVRLTVKYNSDSTSMSIYDNFGRKYKTDLFNEVFLKKIVLSPSQQLDLTKKDIRSNKLEFLLVK